VPDANAHAQRGRKADLPVCEPSLQTSWRSILRACDNRKTCAGSNRPLKMTIESSKSKIDVASLAKRAMSVFASSNEAVKMDTNYSKISSLAIRAAAVISKDNSNVTGEKKDAHKKAREDAQAIYEAAAIAAAAKAQEQKKKREEAIAAILLLLLLAGEDAYHKTYHSLGTEKADEIQIGEQAKTFAASRQKDLKDFAGKLHDALETTKTESEKEKLGEAGIARALRDMAKKVSSVMKEVEATITLGEVNLDRLKRAGFSKVFWSQLDRPTKRMSHAENEQMGIVPIGTVFASGQKYPGDPAGGVGECANCLCVLEGIR
jgi:hypothetical protein